jgi:hypothetical protein
MKERKEIRVVRSQKVRDYISQTFSFCRCWTRNPFAMKLMLRPEWRLWPLSSFLGLLDLKTGVTIALLFVVSITIDSQIHVKLMNHELLNKVAGVYGLIAMLTGSGGSFAQLSLYIYSVIALVGLGWGLRAVKEVRCQFTIPQHFPNTH